MDDADRSPIDGGHNGDNEVDGNSTSDENGDGRGGEDYNDGVDDSSTSEENGEMDDARSLSDSSGGDDIDGGSNDGGAPRNLSDDDDLIPLCDVPFPSEFILPHFQEREIVPLPIEELLFCTRQRSIEEMWRDYVKTYFRSIKTPADRL